MSRLHRLVFAALMGGAALTAQIPNPLNLPDPLGLSKKPEPAPAPRGSRTTRRAPEPGRREQGRKEGKHKGHEGHDNGRHRGKHGH